MVLVAILLVVRQVVRIQEIIITMAWFDLQISVRLSVLIVMLCVSALGCLDRHLAILGTLFRWKLSLGSCSLSVNPATTAAFPSLVRHL